MNDDDRLARRRCTRFLSHHPPATPAATLADMAGHQAAALDADVYGSGGAVALLETLVRELLGKPAGLFFAKGVTAQLCVLRALAERRGTANVALHPMSHLDLDEANAIERVGGIRAIRLGRTTPFGLAALKAVREPLAAVTIELPLRRAGYLLPPLDELEAISAWCRAQGIPLHFDGARLWEAAAGYGITPAALAAMADSVYVSFYKGLGGLGGAMVVGSELLVDSLAVWKTRYGGNLYTVFPYAISALAGIERHLPRMSAYVDRARTFAVKLAAEPRLIVNPARPHVNAFQLLIQGNPAELAARNRAFAEREGIWLFHAFQESPIAGWSTAEIVIGQAAQEHTDDDAFGWIRSFLAQS